MGSLEIDVLIGADHYWRIVTETVVRGDSGPTVIETKLGWVLSRPFGGEDTTINVVSSCSTHALRVDTCDDVEPGLKCFWELESLGILGKEPSIHEKFVQQIYFNGERYTVSLPWKDSHPCLPDNYALCHKRQGSLLRRLNKNRQLLLQYNAVMKAQLQQGIIEIITVPGESTHPIHYLLHHAAVRETTKCMMHRQDKVAQRQPSV